MSELWEEASHAQHRGRGEGSRVASDKKSKCKDPDSSYKWQIFRTEGPVWLGS